MVLWWMWDVWVVIGRNFSGFVNLIDFDWCGFARLVVLMFDSGLFGSGEGLEFLVFMFGSFVLCGVVV